MARIALLLVCSVMLSACSSSGTQTAQYASWDNMDYYTADAASTISDAP
jgi:hypothetical protein